MCGLLDFNRSFCTTFKNRDKWLILLCFFCMPIKNDRQMFKKDLKNVIIAFFAKSDHQSALYTMMHQREWCYRSRSWKTVKKFTESSDKVLLITLKVVKTFTSQLRHLFSLHFENTMFCILGAWRSVKCATLLGAHVVLALIQEDTSQLCYTKEFHWNSSRQCWYLIYQEYRRASKWQRTSSTHQSSLMYMILTLICITHLVPSLSTTEDHLFKSKYRIYHRIKHQSIYLKKYH